MKNLFNLSGFILLTFLFTSVTSKAQTKCDKSLLKSGFSFIKAEKSYFYSEANKNKQKKSFLVAKDFVQILGKSNNTFTCVLYRNYNGYGGKISTGWVLSDTLDQVRTKIERKDLIGIWNKSPCSDESCVVEITDTDGKLEVYLMSYLHNRLSQNYTVGKIQEEPGRLILTELSGSSDAPKKFVIDYKSTKEPGTIKVIGSEGWAGMYHR